MKVLNICGSNGEIYACPFCFGEVDLDDNYCSFCGGELDGEETIDDLEDFKEAIKKLDKKGKKES